MRKNTNSIGHTSKVFPSIPPKRLLVLLLYSFLIFILFAIVMCILTFKLYGVGPIFGSGVSAQYGFGNSGHLLQVDAENRSSMPKFILMLISFLVGSVFLLVYFRVMPIRNDEAENEIFYSKNKKIILFLSVVLYIICLFEIFSE